MKRRYAVYLGLIALLVAINVGRLWLHSGKESEEMAARGKVFMPEDFRLRVDIPSAEEGAGRNLFQPHGSASLMMITHSRKTAVKAGMQQPTPPVQAETEAGLGKLRLLGVVFHAGKRQAYLALDKESVIAVAGDTAFGQFVVDKIAVDAVELRDPKNNTTRRIPVSGK